MARFHKQEERVTEDNDLVKAVTFAETYAACVERLIHRLTWEISVALSFYCKGYDVGNASAEGPAPEDPFFK